MTAQRAALYARVSTHDQTCDNQLLALRAYVEARGWQATEYVDHAVSGAKDRRPALDALLAAARARKIDFVVCVKLDRLARSVRHLVTMAGELEALGVDLVVLDQQLDTSSPSGRLLFHVLASISEFERSLVIDRVRAGLRRAKVRGTRSGRAIGRPRAHDVEPADVLALHAEGPSLSEIGRRLGNGRPVHPTVIRRTLERASQTLAP